MNHAAPPFAPPPRASTQSRWWRVLSLSLVTALALTACGGGSDPSDEDRAQAAARPRNDTEAHRFLVQSTFGPSLTDIGNVKALGYDAWINEQWMRNPGPTHLDAIRFSASVMRTTGTRSEDIVYSWWTRALTSDAQLRHRVAFALSEIFVVSTLTLSNAQMVANYMDTLSAHAGGRYRDLLEAVALHPAMGMYLSHMSNRKADGKGRLPDENFAREVMQLFSIGLYELNDAGQPKLVNGKFVESYNGNDIKGLARVFTGFSWSRPASKAGVAEWKCFWRNSECTDDSQDITPMQAYASEHEPGIKQFLGVTIPEQATADPRASLKVALDTLANHPNTAPFISRQLIQRLVTSNPSDAYVTAITQTFRSSGGNLSEVVKAILLHDEARRTRTSGSVADAHFGKLREPLLRLTHLLRSVPHTSDRLRDGGNIPFYQSIESGDAATTLGQTPMRSPSVFNFFRPGYTPPKGTATDAARLVAPEMQITSETSVLGYANFVADILESGWGEWNPKSKRRDIQFDLSGWMPQALTPETLVDAISMRLMGRTLPATTRQTAIAAITAMPSTSDKQKRQRIQAAILMVSVSPSFLIQQ